jgi:uncharacterized protein YegP (UPF0339 family)
VNPNVVSNCDLSTKLHAETLALSVETLILRSAVGAVGRYLAGLQANAATSQAVGTAASCIGIMARGFTMAGKFELKKGKTGKFSFNLKSGNGQVVFTSQTYDSKRSATAGIASVKKNAGKDGAFERKKSTKGQPYFVIKATNGQVIGKSQMYATPVSMEKGIKSVAKNAPLAETNDLTVEPPKTDTPAKKKAPAKKAAKKTVEKAVKKAPVEKAKKVAKKAAKKGVSKAKKTVKAAPKKAAASVKRAAKP